MEENVLLLVEENGVVSITVNRPKSLNALNIDVLQSFIIELEKIASREDVRVVLITGAGEKAFVAGADIHSMASFGKRAISEYIELGQRVMRKLETLSVPVVAKVNGFALGGGMELMLACDVVFISENAKLGQPEVNLGIIPGFGGTQRIIQRAGVGTARRLTFGGEIITANEAFTLGLVDKVVVAEELDACVNEFLTTITMKAPLAVKKAKEVIRLATENTLLSGLRHEVEAFNELFQTEDCKEGMAAFLEKRPANFKGK
ncbi:MAG: enoyl-CoA hydratase/isomerase family protein [Bdellovibrionales bacterium]|nr:enoyl-CoA hydratase/isomerase family protein [Bdellovibrionales bacterium]